MKLQNGGAGVHSTNFGHLEFEAHPLIGVVGDRAVDLIYPPLKLQFERLRLGRCEVLLELFLDALSLDLEVVLGRPPSLVTTNATGPALIEVGISTEADRLEQRTHRGMRRALTRADRAP